MSIKAIVETFVHVHSFRNIDLYEQGVYMLKISLSDQSQATSSPYLLEQAARTKLFSPKHKLLDSQLEDYLFFTRAFLIKYAEEEVHVNDIAVFRSEIDFTEEAASLSLAVSLLYAEIRPGAPEDEVVANPPTMANFNEVATAIVSIPHPLQGVNQFVPVKFSESYPCQVNLCVHVMQLDFRHRLVKGTPTSSTDLTQLTADLMFGSFTELNAKDVDLAYAMWVKHLIKIHQRNRQLIENLVEEIDDEDMHLYVPENVREAHSRYSEMCTHREPFKVARRILKDIQVMAAQLHHLEMSLIEVVKQYPLEVALAMQKEYIRRVKEHWGGAVFRDLHLVSSLVESTESSSGEQHAKVADMLRNTPMFARLNNFEAVQESLFAGNEFHPVLFQDIFYLSHEQVQDLWNPEWFTYMPNPAFKRKGLHLIVFVHGFQGSSFDVKLIKNSIASLRPDCSLLCSNMNEGETEGDIAHMGKRLAIEITRHIKDWCPQSMLRKISFIGHSLGGVIIRAALPMLLDYSGLFHFYMSFSSPHLGYMYNTSPVVGAGMWLLRKFKKSESLHQLSMTDSYDLRETFLYKLSQMSGFGYFKHIALVSSFQDSYAPYESARIAVNQDIHADQLKSPYYVEMANNILSQVQTGKVYRLDVNYKSKSQTIDHWIGRSAHIEMLENESVLEMIMFSCAHFFE